eukprot:jgi/Mesvir1/13790/Mv15955-RA.1
MASSSDAGADQDPDALLREFFSEVSTVQRDAEVIRILGAFKLNPYEQLNLKFDAGKEDIKKQYRKISLMIHPDKCHHPQAKEAFGVLQKAYEELQNDALMDNLRATLNFARELVVNEHKKEVKKKKTEQTANPLLKHLEKDEMESYLLSDAFQHAWKMKAREVITQNEWRRRKMTQRITEEETRVEQEEAETREMYKRKRDDAEKWEDTREGRVASWRDFQTKKKDSGKKKAVGELRPPKLKTSDSVKSYVQRPVQRG